MVPLISSVQAGAWCEVREPTPAYDAKEWLPCPVRNGRGTYALKVEGESMDGPGGYREGEIVFVDPTVQATPGRDVIVRTPEGKAMMKRLKEDAEGLYLLALNPQWPNRIIRVPRDTVICGVVIGSFMAR